MCGRMWPRAPAPPCHTEREFFIDNLLVRIHSTMLMIRWTGLAPWAYEFPFPGGLTSTFLYRRWTKQAATIAADKEVPPPPSLREKIIQLKPFWRSSLLHEVFNITSKEDAV